MFMDQGTQFTSEEFKKFAAEYDFKIEHSAPRNPQANGFAEAMVKVTKGLMLRALAAGEDALQALQIYRATPFKPGMPSPAEMLHSRKIRMRILQKDCAQLKQIQEAAREKQLQEKVKQKEYFDKWAKAYEKLQLHQEVRFQMDPHKAAWTPAVVVELLVVNQPQTYTV